MHCLGKRDDLPVRKCRPNATVGFRPNSWSRTICAALTSVLHESYQRKEMGEDGHLPNDVRSVSTSILFTRGLSRG